MLPDFNAFSDWLEARIRNGLPGEDAQIKMSPRHRASHEATRPYHADARKGGVLILFYPHARSIYTVLIQRPTYDGVHSGQVAFPGGAFEDQDRHIIDTALREANEEVGIIQEQVKVLGELSQLYIPPSNFLVTPVVGTSANRPHFVPEPGEVEAIIEADLFHLMDEKILGIKKIQVRGMEIESPFYDIEGHTVWGATAMMISELNELLKDLKV